ncbi:hypothetical protein GX48_04145 [Paracoccidioides brasiliensis]|nr:hypothetical protein GX48_04145 [Paracoccidioides brasiliensis]
MPYLGSTERPLATDGAFLRSQTSLRAVFMIDSKFISFMVANLSSKRLGLIPVPALRDQTAIETGESSLDHLGPGPTLFLQAEQRLMARRKTWKGNIMAKPMIRTHYDPQRTTAKWYYFYQLGYPKMNCSLEMEMVRREDSADNRHTGLVVSDDTRECSTLCFFCYSFLPIMEQEPPTTRWQRGQRFPGAVFPHAHLPQYGHRYTTAQ